MSVSEAEVGKVVASYARCREKGGFIEAFYRQLWARDPMVKQRFEGTNMDRQHEVMREAINTLLMYSRGSRVAAMALDRLRQSHDSGGHDVHSGMYALFLDIIVDTARAWDPLWEESLAQAWRAALEPGIEHMQDQGTARGQ